MPSLPSTDSKILITGANGYVGAWVVKIALERGYTVRAVVRSESKANVVKGLFADHVKNGKLEFAFVEDLVQDGAFDEAVKGVNAIIHLASPLPSPKPDPQETIRPAVQGTLGVLKSALKNGKDVKRIVITSSTASLTMLGPVSATSTTYTEADWNNAVIDAIEAGETNTFIAYAASKTLAEKAAWEFHNTHKPTWDITTLNPPFIYGPTLLPAKTPADIGGTQGIWHSIVIAAGDKAKDQIGEKNGYAWVDVRDIAEAHIRSLEKEEAGGERIIVSSGPYIWQEWIDVANSVAASPVFPSALQASLPKGLPELTAGEVTHLAQFDSSKSAKVLGIKYRTKEQTVEDILKDAGSKGWVPTAN